jgi:hypothetical protein
MWLAELPAPGLIRASFAPNAQTHEMCGLLRTRKQLVREQSSHVLRLQKIPGTPSSNWTRCLPPARCITTSAAIISSATPTDQQEKRLVKRWSEFGYAVELKPLVASLWH